MIHRARTRRTLSRARRRASTIRTSLPGAPALLAVALLAGATPSHALVTQLAVTPTGFNYSDLLGNSVAPAGDMNGDGFDDLIVGASYATTSAGFGTGRVYVYFGGPVLDATADLTLSGSTAFDQFGISVASAGDFNGDGYSDVIVGAFTNDAGGTDAGRAYIYFGGASPDATADVVLTGQAAGDVFGASVSGAGDVNTDGFDDVIVGAPQSDASGNNAGRAYVYYGGSSPDNVVDNFLNGAVANDAFGASVAKAGDVNGDGRDDVIVGAPLNNASALEAGAAYVWFGAELLTALPNVTLPGSYLSRSGTSVAAAGDMNNDGFGDVIIGGSNLSTAYAGVAYVFLGGASVDTSPDLSVYGEIPHDGFGATVASAGDVNNDGFDDVIVGARANNGGGFSIGRAYIWFGGTVLNAVTDVFLTGKEIDENSGAAVASAGDLNGDGFPDVVVGAPYNDAGGALSTGRAYVYTFSRYQVLTPNGGETWNVGAAQKIRWRGDDLADVWLSVDGGATFERIRSSVGGNDVNVAPLQVPHAPTRFAVIQIAPSDPSLRGMDQSDLRFTIQASVSLFNLTAEPDGDATLLSWATEPSVGPEGLLGYRLYRATAGSGDAGTRIGPDLIVETHYRDRDAAPGCTYRLVAVNGLGEELRLGETASRPFAALSAWPLPYRGGELHVAFATAGGLAGMPSTAEVTIHDVSGRLVRRLVQRAYTAGMHTATWDGRDDRGRNVASGVYILHVHSGIDGHQQQRRLVVIR